MSEEKAFDIAIVGAGLAGLSLAWYLQGSGLSIAVLEASARLGGRIHTLKPAGESSHLELGATWFGPRHRHLRALMEELGLSYFAQSHKGKALFQSMSFAKPQTFDIPDGQEEPTYRVIGGTDRLIEGLRAQIVARGVRIFQPFKLRSVQVGASSMQLEAVDGQSLSCTKLVLTQPPAVVADSVAFEGGQIASEQWHIMRNTHTWMHNSIKFGWISDAAYWQQQGFAGTFFSQVGPITEMYDHSNAEGTFFALKGFLSGGVSAYSAEERLQMVQAQMAACIPFWSDKAFEYVEKDWSKDSLLNPITMDLLPHQNNGHPLLRKPIIEGKVWLGGTECASAFPGYMDGAVQRAMELSKELQTA